MLSVLVNIIKCASFAFKNFKEKYFCYYYSFFKHELLTNEILRRQRCSSVTTLYSFHTQIPVVTKTVTE
jgi:hypothetical protein